MDNSLKSALKKAKLKQLLKMILTALIVVLVLLPILYKTGNHFAAKGAERLHERLFLHNAIAEPNIHIDSQMTSSSSTFGGNITTNRSKNVNGYLVQWSTLTSSYDWFRVDLDFNEMVPGFHWTDTQFYEYDKQTKNKAATFYHPSIKEYYSVQNELSAVSGMENHVVEVAISFDRPYKWREIEKRIPDNLNTVWLYMASPIADESNGPAGVSVYGFDPGDEPGEAFKGFLGALKKYDKSGHIETIQEFLKTNEKKAFEDVEILGVLLTGRTQNFKALENEDFIRGSSVGATAEIVPYIKPDK